MSRLQLNKSSLAKEMQALKSFQRFLPSLDLKRQQLLTERANAYHKLKSLEEQQQALQEIITQNIPMLANSEIDVDGLVVLEAVRLGEQNVVGTRLPTIQKILFTRTDYSFFSKPHWVDNLCVHLEKGITLGVETQVQRLRINQLEKAVATITQRVNLFEKVLIPQAEANIKRIRIYLSDEQMVAVVRAKIAKQKTALRMQENQPTAPDDWE